MKKYLLLSTLTSCYASKLISPGIFYMMCFLLCAAVSMLTGTSFGTVATMGVICQTMASTMGMNMLISGGAVISGIMVGDRQSPVSTSNLLVATLTDTDMYQNMKNMTKSMILPFILSTAIYFILGLFFSSNVMAPDLFNIFSSEINISVLCFIPAIILLILAILKVKVVYCMLASIITSIPIAVIMQGYNGFDLIYFSIKGFEAKDLALAPLINGGGIANMFETIAIIAISGVLSEIFEKTKLLDKIGKYVDILLSKTTPYFTVLIISSFLSMICCSQTLATLLSLQLIGKDKIDKNELAYAINDSDVIIAPLIPWSIASIMPITTINASKLCLLFAFYCYLIPLYRTGVEIYHGKKNRKNKCNETS